VAQSFNPEEVLSLARDLVHSGDLANAKILCGKILKAVPNQPQALHILGICAFQHGDPDEAVRFLRRAIDSDSGFALAAGDLGNILAQQGKLAQAIASFRQAIASAPAFAEAHNNLGNVLQVTGSLEESVACYRAALAVRPKYPEALRNLASALRRLNRPQDAVWALRAALALDPAMTESVALLAQQSKELCDWSQIEELTANLTRAVEGRLAPVNPFIFLSLETTPKQQFLCAQQWASAHYKPVAARPKACKPDGPITVAYLSADFQEHATAHLTSELFELHDRSRFRILGYSYGHDDGSAARRRLRNSFDQFIDIEAASHADAAARIETGGVDILIDLKGYTADARPEILMRRPAPIQVSYLGYPGTMGTTALDYILVDSTIVPASEQPYFAERLVHLPHCYQVNNRQRPISPHIPSRANCGLPEPGFVFCCFNAAYKIAEPVFDVWMRLLAHVPGSVVWLLEPSTTAMENLRREAERRLAGAGERLIFAPSLPNPSHLARFALADLCLDTLPYNAHTLTSDALWGGCPVITCRGNAFPGRVAASLLHAIGLPELVTDSLPAYEVLAWQLAQDHDRLRSIRAKLATNRLTTPLFDSRRFTKALESAYQTMWEIYRGGEAPRSFQVADED
jgi:predicted O-linked N-acetylglucosamine transferase (SPINDLY family)